MLLYATAWRVSKANFAAMMIMALAIACSEGLLGYGPHVVVIVLLHGCFSFLAHRSALLGDAQSNETGHSEDVDDLKLTSVWRFGWRGIAFCAFVGVLILAVSLLLYAVIYLSPVNDLTIALL
ncbi:MAG: hypothetical protein AAGA38_01405 [Pseudomonadota bacterium]